MWALIEDGQIVREYSRPTTLKIGKVNHPAQIFSNATRLAGFGIIPIRRRQVNSPGDTTMYDAVVVDTVLSDHVDRAISYVVASDLIDRAAALRDSRVRGLLSAARAIVQTRTDAADSVDSRPADIVELQINFNAAKSDIDALPVTPDYPEQIDAIVAGLTWIPVEPLP